jgi:hypothetical protein
MGRLVKLWDRLVENARAVAALNYAGMISKPETRSFRSSDLVPGILTLEPLLGSYPGFGIKSCRPHSRF